MAEQNQNQQSQNRGTTQTTRTGGGQTQASETGGGTTQTQVTPAPVTPPVTDAPATGGKGAGGKQGGGGGGKPSGGGGGGKPSGGAGDQFYGGGGKPGGGGGGNPLFSGTQAYQPGGGFYDFQSRPIAGTNLLHGAGVGYTGQAGDLYGQLPGIAGTQVTGANVATDPAVQQANKVFQDVMSPMIKDAAGLAGIGKSGAMTNALSAQQAQTLLPLIQGSMQREERGIDRRLGGTQAAAAGLQGVGGQTFGMGEGTRNIEQEILNAPYDEQMRLFSEALNSIYGPFGMIPGMFGSSSTTTGGGKK